MTDEVKPTADRRVVVATGKNRNVANPSSPPRPTLTAFGPKIQFVARSYAPFESFGTPDPVPGFEGDGVRDATAEASATARIRSMAQLLTDRNTVQFLAFSDSSSWPALPFKHDRYSYWPVIIPHLQVTSTAQPRVDGEAVADLQSGTLKIAMHHSGQAPLVHPQFITPDIDLYTEFMLAIGVDGSLKIATAMYGDAFPNAEAFARFGDGRAVLLHHFETDAGKLGPNYMLWGDSKRPMGSTTVVIPATRAKAP